MNWLLHDVHSVYGKVVMMGIIGGEPYRWFQDKHGGIAMMPLAVLDDLERNNMGTNYYYHRDACPHCGRSETTLHIGKSSSGWCFSLHVDPSQRIVDLEDWKLLFAEPDCRIRNEYGRDILTQEMIEIITVRKFNRPPTPTFDHERNRAEPGPDGLVRHKVDGHYCVGHGEGTWDHIMGEFS